MTVGTSEPGEGDARPPPPQAPLPPDPGDCCGGGCLHCVYDLYDQALERYQQALAEWRRQCGQ
jgi:hypothetical protein